MADSHSTSRPRTLADKIIAQAQGSPTAEAAAIIVTAAIHGRLLDAAPLIGEDHHMAEIDWDLYRTQTGHLSGGERRLFALADSLATGQPVDLSDTLAGLDDRNGRVVLEAVAHALHLGGLVR